MSPLTCIALAVYFEARGEPIEGQEAVASVVMERVMSRHYPDKACEVVFQDKQFSAFNGGEVPPIYDIEALDLALQVAASVVNNHEKWIGATHYHTVDIRPYWADSYTVVAVVGNHIFYK